MANDTLKKFHGKRVAVFGPNYIWTGDLVEETDDTIVLSDVNQLFETGPHTTVETEHERICENMVFYKSAVCNVGDPLWTADANTVPRKHQARRNASKEIVWQQQTH